MRIIPSMQAGSVELPRRAGLTAGRLPDYILALLPILLLPLLWLSLVAAPALRVDVGAWGDDAALAGVHGVEQDGGEDYRWTTGTAHFSLPNLSSRYQLLQLRASGWRPGGQPAPLVRLDAGGQPWGTIQAASSMRVYQVLLPRNTTPTTTVGLHMSAYAAPGDPRELGVALDWIELVALDSSGAPTFWQLAGQLLLLALLLVLLWALALAPPGVLALGASLAAGLLWANIQQPLWVAQALGAWLILALLLLAATWWVGPRLERLLRPWMTARQAQLVWALFVAGLALRLFGAAHPLFSAHDLDVHTGWLAVVERGQLYLYSTPGELRNRQIFNPPGGYLLLAPLTLLLPSARMVVQVGVALLDAIGCLLLVPLACELRMRPVAALLALALVITLPINTTMLWWGFATNALAQPLWLLLLWLLLRLARQPAWPALLVAAMVCAVCLLMHAGALVLMVATLGLFGLFGWRRTTLPGRRALLGALVLAVIVLGPLYFAAAAGPILEQRVASGSAPSTAGPSLLDVGSALEKGWAHRDLRLELVRNGLLRGFSLPLLVLLPPGLLRLLAGAPRQGLQRVLVLVWLAVCAGFAAAYLGLGMVTRYIYFVAPLVCLAGGAALADYRRHPAGRAMVLAILLLSAWIGLSLWTAGVLLHVKPSVVPLTH